MNLFTKEDTKEIHVHHVGDHEVVEHDGYHTWQCRKCDKYAFSMETYEDTECHNCNCQYCNR